MVIGGIFAGMVNTVSGSGTLFTLGVMALMNIPLNLANIATRPGVFFQNVTGILVLRRYKQFSLDDIQVAPLIITCTGALLGAVGATVISSGSFNVIATFVMFFLFVQNVLPKRIFKLHLNIAEGVKGYLQHILFFLIGIYGGFIQIGIGILLLSVLIGYLKLPYNKANAFKLVIVLIYTIPTTLYFIISDAILWKPALLLALGQIIGAYLAAVFVSTKPDAAKWAKRVTLLMIIVTLIKIWFF